MGNLSFQIQVLHLHLPYLPKQVLPLFLHLLAQFQVLALQCRNQVLVLDGLFEVLLLHTEHFGLPNSQINIGLCALVDEFAWPSFVVFLFRSTILILIVDWAFLRLLLFLPLIHFVILIFLLLVHEVGVHNEPTLIN